MQGHSGARCGFYRLVTTALYTSVSRKRNATGDQNPWLITVRLLKFL